MPRNEGRPKSPTSAALVGFSKGPWLSAAQRPSSSTHLQPPARCGSVLFSHRSLLASCGCEQ
eukprot:COSAG04_NODE_15031_length_546_cov_1.042506_2_plen_61_part_01